MKKYFAILFLLVFMIFLSGCINILPTLEDDSIAPGKGRLKIYLTDSSGDYKTGDDENYLEVNITISKIEAHIAGEDEEPWDVLKEWMIGEEPTFDLKKLEDVSVLLASLELEPNRYTQLRLFLKDDEDDAWLILNDSTRVSLEIPSVYQTGIKLIHPFEIVEGMITKLTIDFDADKSVVKTGNEEYKLKPVIKLTSETYSVGDLYEYPGSISGIVLEDSETGPGPPISGATVSVSLSGGVYIFNSSALTDEDGSFFIDQLPVGTYTLTASAEDYIDHTEYGIIITEGATIGDIDIDIVLVPVS